MTGTDNLAQVARAGGAVPMNTEKIRQGLIRPEPGFVRNQGNHRTALFSGLLRKPGPLPRPGPIPAVKGRTDAKIGSDQDRDIVDELLRMRVFLESLPGER